MLSQIVHGVIGLLGFVCVAILLSNNRRQIKIKPIVIGLIFQVGLALVISRLHIIIELFQWLNKAVIALCHATMQGTSFVFGYIGGGPAPFVEKAGETQYLFSLGFQALPLIIVIAALASILFYLRILPCVIRLISWLIRKPLGVGGPMATGIASNLFIGMCEAPFVIKPYLYKLTYSELFTLMTCGMAGVAGTVMALYVTILSPIIPDVLVHVISSVIISVPAVIMISRIIVPETEPVTIGSEISSRRALNVIDALINGVKQGTEAFVSILAMLIVLIALVAFLDKLLAVLPTFEGHKITITYLLGFVFAPFMWLMGIPWHEVHVAGQLMAQRMVLNELVSFQSLANLPHGVLDHRVTLMLMYAMCGFANFTGLGIMLATYNILIPKRRKEFIQVGIKSMLAGTLCTCMTGTIIGMIYTG